MSDRAVHLAASVLLSYPDERLAGALPLLQATVAELEPGEPARRLAAFLDHVAATPLAELAEHYVATFDLKRRCCPYLTYYTYGDTRRRGMALLRFKQAYQAAGFEVTGELPDHLGVVCELSGRGATHVALRLLREHRAGLETLLRALSEEKSPYAGVVAAVLATLPPPTERERRAALRLAEEGPPAEEVGLEPYGLEPYGFEPHSPEPHGLGPYGGGAPDAVPAPFGGGRRGGRR
ncbi:nitrate reductase molybdenum cofactor assembly chaperone [Microbispora sp. H10830]|uniref:nitrate reductase molybdenum cofactor assembly chaperone n=1 Tax=Microbispora sp. H10830 TaxID=2729109 RepID=UPI00160299B7|nr:nitrate reductase molybdenum cofactor assembly chaperone [Microbispora sp. H10830]